MSSVKEIESALTGLPLTDLQAVRDWLDDFIEDQLEVSDEFRAKIERSKQEIAKGVHSRTRKPETGPGASRSKSIRAISMRTFSNYPARFRPE
jgi:hypothetical protein